jgi:hypothetical protein
MRLSDDSEASVNKLNTKSDSCESDFDDTDSEWVDVTENNDNQTLANFQYQEMQGPKQAPTPLCICQEQLECLW